MLLILIWKVSFATLQPPFSLGTGPEKSIFKIAVLIPNLKEGATGAGAVCGAALAQQVISGRLKTDMPPPLAHADVELVIREHRQLQSTAVQEWRNAVHNGTQAVIGPGGELHVVKTVPHSQSRPYYCGIPGCLLPRHRLAVCRDSGHLGQCG